MEVGQKLKDLNETITNLARARQDCVGTPGETDATIVGHLDAMLLRSLNDGTKNVKELIISEAMLGKDESAATALFYSLRRQVLAILQTEETEVDTAATT